MKTIKYGMGLLFVLMAGCASPNTPDTDAYWRQCEAPNVDMIQQGCSALIASGKIGNRNLGVAYTNRGAAYLGRRNLAAARADFEAALRVRPNYVPALIDLGVLDRMTKDYDQAIASLTAAINSDAHSAFAYVNRAGVYILKGDFQSSLADLNAALKIEPDTSSIYEERCLVYARLNDFHSALADCNGALGALPGLKVLLTASDFDALAKPGLGGTFEANRNTFLKAPLVAGILSARGYVYLRMKDYQSAIADFNAALNVNSGSALRVYSAPNQIGFSSDGFRREYALYGRGLARLATGDEKAGNADIDAALLGFEDVRAIVREEWGLPAP